jgi:transposase
VYGYKLHVVVTVCPQAQVWLPLAAALTPANVADSTQAPLLLDDLAPLVLARLFILADSAYRDPDVRARCARAARVLVASRRGTPARDDGSAVRQVFHALRAQAIERWNAQFKHSFDLGAQLPTTGLVATQRFVLGAVFVYPLTVLDRFLVGRSLRCGLQAALQAA